MDYENNCLTVSEVAEELRALLAGDDLEDTLLDGCRTRSYNDGGYLTYDEGFTIDINGHRFQITVRQER